MAKLVGMPTRPRSSLSSFVNARHSGPLLIEFCVKTSPQSWHIVSPWSKSSIRFKLPHSGQRWTLEEGLSEGRLGCTVLSLFPLSQQAWHEGYSTGLYPSSEHVKPGKVRALPGIMNIRLSTSI